VILLDYILEAEALRKDCLRPDVLRDYALPEWEMLMRLRIGEIEVFGRTQEEYQRWVEHLRSNNLPVDVPSAAWSRLSVLSIAVDVERAFSQLRETGTAEIDSLDCSIHLELDGSKVRVWVRRDRVGQALLTDVHAGFTAFAERVRLDFLAICPELRGHVTLGTWFRGEPREPTTGEPGSVIYLP
jgi:hypothetical protein